MSLQQTRLGNKLEVIYYCQSHSLNERPWKIVSNSNNLDQYRTSLPVVVVGVVYVCVCVWYTMRDTSNRNQNETNREDNLLKEKTDKQPIHSKTTYI